MEKELRTLAQEFPIVSIYGPRQSGKTTLAKMTFPEKRWISFEDPDILSMAREDPRGFLQGLVDGAFLDEVQRIPELLSYLQKNVDEDPRPGRFILSGSHQVPLKKGIAQSLAGRTAVLTLLPLSMEELFGMGGESVPSAFELLYKGFYPRPYQVAIRPRSFFSSYVLTYLDRDLPELLAVRNRSLFQDFLFLLASRVGQVLNLSSLGNDLGVSSTTLAGWVSALEESNLVFRLTGWSRNATRQVVKASKLYFTDTGLAAYLAKLQRVEDLEGGMLRGGLFENFVVMEVRKYLLNHAVDANLHYFRDSRGNEVDLVIDCGTRLIPVEIKSASTFKTDFCKGIELFHRLYHTEGGFVAYNGIGDIPAYHGIRIVNPFNAHFAEGLFGSGAI